MLDGQLALYVTPLRVLLAASLLYAGLWKLLAPEKLAATLFMTGWRRVASRHWVRVLGLVELSVGTLAAMVTGWTAGLPVAALGLAFGCAGLVAVRSGTSVPCHCFMSVDSTLGWTQVALMPFWLAASVAISVSPISSLDGLAVGTAAALLASTAAVVATHRASRVLRELRLAVGPLGGDVI
jgi:hypothetical protein